MRVEQAATEQIEIIDRAGQRNDLRVGKQHAH
jgi:hypothetical protein